MPASILPSLPSPPASGAVDQTLDLLPDGSLGVVTAITGEPQLRRRLLEMGLCRGVVIEAIRRAPLGDPIEFRLRGYHLSLRAAQARLVRITPQLSANAT